MDSGIQKSILQMARGAIQERADYEMSSLLNNILDPNTSATAARKLTITLTLKPDDTRQNITVSCVATSKLAATNPVTTALYVAAWPGPAPALSADPTAALPEPCESRW